MTHDYKRHGTTTLFAALNVLDGTVIGRNMQRHRHQEFIRFLNAIDAEVPPRRHLDNYAAHKHPKCVPGSIAISASPSTSRRPRARGSTQSKASSRSCRCVVSSEASCTPVVDLQAAINRFLAEHNQKPKPFTWTADSDKIIAAVKRGHQVLNSIH